MGTAGPRSTLSSRSAGKLAVRRVRRPWSSEQLSSEKQPASFLRIAEIFAGNFNAQRFPAQPKSHQVRRSGAGKGVQHDASFRTSGKERYAAEILGIRREMRLSFLRILRENVPHIAGFGAIGVVFEEVEAALG